jgi:hypothetical protein
MGKLTEAQVRTTKATDKDQWLNDGYGSIPARPQGWIKDPDYTPQTIRQKTDHYT